MNTKRMAATDYDSQRRCTGCDLSRDLEEYEGQYSTMFQHDIGCLDAPEVMSAGSTKGFKDWEGKIVASPTAAWRE